MRWKNLQHVGFSVKSITELERAMRLGCDLVEIKVDGFAKSGTPIYEYRGGRFILNRENLDLIYNLTKWSTSLQFHLPIENTVDIESEVGLNPGILEHHDILLRRFRMFEEISQFFSKKIVLTMHQPLVSVGYVDVLPRDQVVDNSSLFFETLDIERKAAEDKCNTIICLENMTDEKKKAGNLGYMKKHFKALLKNTRTICLTMDVGHRRLTRHFRVRDFLSLGIPIGNFHFHGNAGGFDPDDWADDAHLLPTKHNVENGKRGYDNYIRYFKRHRAPIVLEISHLEKYSDEELENFLKNFRKELE